MEITSYITFIESNLFHRCGRRKLHSIPHLHDTDLFKINIVMINLKNGLIRIDTIWFLGILQFHKLKTLMEKICLTFIASELSRSTSNNVKQNLGHILDVKNNSSVSYTRHIWLIQNKGNQDKIKKGLDW